MKKDILQSVMNRLREQYLHELDTNAIALLADFSALTGEESTILLRYCQHLTDVAASAVELDDITIEDLEDLYPEIDAINDPPAFFGEG